MPCARLRRAVVLKDQALGVFVSEVSSPLDWIRRLITDRLVQASGIALESSQARIRLSVDDENILHSAPDALGIVSEAGPANQLLLVKVLSDAALDALAVSKKIQHDQENERSTNFTGMWQRA